MLFITCVVADLLKFLRVISVMIYTNDATYRCGQGNLSRQSNTRKYLNPYSNLLDETVRSVRFVANCRGKHASRNYKIDPEDLNVNF